MVVIGYMGQGRIRWRKYVMESTRVMIDDAQWRIHGIISCFHPKERKYADFQNNKAHNIISCYYWEQGTKQENSREGCAMEWK